MVVPDTMRMVIAVFGVRPRSVRMPGALPMRMAMRMPIRMIEHRVLFANDVGRDGEHVRDETPQQEEGKGPGPVQRPNQ